MTLDVVVLAAGQGTRMCSALPKVLHSIAGKPMLAHVLDVARTLSPASIHVVIGHGAETVRSTLAADDLSFVVQAEQLGTGHAVAQAVPNLSAEYVLVLYGDVPLIEQATLERLLADASANQLTLLTVFLADPTGYGRIVRTVEGVVQAIVEQKDATPEQLAIREGNTGILIAPRQRLQVWLSRLSNQNAQGEYYLTDVIAMAVAEGVAVRTQQPESAAEVMGANDRQQLAQLERVYQLRAAHALMAQGVSLRDPGRFDVRGQVTVGRDIVIDVNVILEGQVVIEDQVHIESHCVLRNVLLRQGARVKAFSHLDGAELGTQSDCGPFARLRPGTVLGPRAHVGNFVEVKNTHLGEGTKAGHLSYLGDTRTGAACNIGAGTITCNYDGVNKWPTVLGDNVFVGSNTALVAPLNVGDDATIGAGSTITQDLPAATLGVARAKQRVIEHWRKPSKKP